MTRCTLLSVCYYTRTAQPREPLPMASSSSAAVQLSAYEQQRLDNIARNEAFLKSIGLGDVQASIKEINRQEQLQAKNNDENQLRGSSSSSCSRTRGKRQRANADADAAPTVVRRSVRGRTNNGTLGDDNDNGVAVGGLQRSTSARAARQLPHAAVLDGVDVGTDADDGGKTRTRITTASLRAYIDAANVAHSQRLDDKDLAHTVYRVGYMSTVQLAKRVKDISRGAGKKSHDKMLIFYYALRASGLSALACLALKVLRALDVDGLPELEEEERSRRKRL